MRVLITGGAGFVGSRLALAFKHENQNARIVAFDNLKRRGSELHVLELREKGIEFVHGDIRVLSDLEDLSGDFDVLVEASAEPSVLAGLQGSPAYLIQTNLQGTLNCLELARKRGFGMIFLSTSRVYSIEPLRGLALRELPTRFELDATQSAPGVTPEGISTTFPTHLPRSLYGATKLASELLIQEYATTYGVHAVIDRCGVIAGPGQLGKTDQGVFTFWVASHFFKRSLRYTGFGGLGKQVRDLLHPADLASLIVEQARRLSSLHGEVYNVGGGPARSTSLLELTGLCERMTGNRVPVASEPASPSVDIPYFVTDHREVSRIFGWRPSRSVEMIVQDIADWLRQDEQKLRPIFST